MQKVYVEFQVTDRDKFLTSLTEWDQSQERKADSSGAGNCVIGFRADDVVSKRAALVAFVDAMEVKLRRNEHKSTWKEKPVEALFRLALLEVEEFRVALEFFSVKEARAEIPDACNFLMMVWDRMGSLDQDRPAGVQK